MTLDSFWGTEQYFLFRTLLLTFSVVLSLPSFLFFNSSYPKRCELLPHFSFDCISQWLITVFSPIGWSCQPCQIHWLDIRGLLLVFLFYSSLYRSVCMPVLHLFLLLYIVISFETRKCGNSTFCLFVCFFVFGLFGVPWDSMWLLEWASISAKKYIIETLIGILD